jgi:HrpA-like RNA helicase
MKIISFTPKAHSTPEILRVPLDNLLLKIASMSLEESHSQLLNRCPDPPSEASIQAAIKSLACKY